MTAGPHSGNAGSGGKGVRGLVRRFWQPALWTLFVLNVLLLPLLFGGAGDEPFLPPGWIPTSPVALVLVHVLLVAFALPNTVFCLAAGFLFGLGPGMVYATLGTFLGSLAAFAVGRLFLRRWLAPWLGRFRSVSRILAALGDAGVRTVCFTRLSPLFPFAFQNFGWATTPVRFRNYALGSFLAAPVGACFFAHLGAAARAGATLATESFSWSAALTILGLLATFYLIRRVTRIANAALKDELPTD